MEGIRQVLFDQLGLRYTFPSSESLAHSTRCLLYEDEGGISEGDSGWEDGPSIPQRHPREVVVKACPRGAEDALLAILSGLYDSCRVVEAASASAPLWHRLPPSPMYPKHPGLLPLLALCRGRDGGLFFISEYYPQNLLTLLHFSSQSLLESSLLGRNSRESVMDLRLFFLFYQLIRILAFYHKHPGRSLSNLAVTSVYVSDMIWLRVLPPPPTPPLAPSPAPPSAPPPSSNCSIPRPPGHDVPLTLRWMEGRVGNLEYLMAINAAAGRSMIDAIFHPVLPWVSDLKLQNGGWRDLSKSKFRLNKGDAQLDSAYRHSTPPHHITESLSEITYYIYMARRTPLAVLRRVVRADFVPQHYPSNIARMFDWTPDECIPEFFVDASVFASLHRAIGMADVSFPPWCPDASAFIAYHRALLESEEVSARMHLWIDLTFGHCLEGAAAVHNKNVPLRSGEAGTGQRVLGHDYKNPGFVQIFREPHPQRRSLRRGLNVLQAADLQAAACRGRESEERGGHASYVMAVQGVEVTGDETDMLRRAPTVPVEDRNLQQIRDCVASPDVVQAVGSFAQKAKARLEPAYSLTGPPPLPFSSFSHSTPVSCSPLQPRSPTAPSQAPTQLEQQRDDMFAAGCILAELYLGKPVMSIQEVASLRQNSLSEGAMVGGDAAAGGEGRERDDARGGGLAGLQGETYHLPYHVRALLHSLLQRDPTRRPRAVDLLRTEEGVDSDEEEEDGQPATREVGVGVPGARLLDGPFPPYFQDMYRYLSTVYLHQSDGDFESISVTLSLAQQLTELPLPAFALILPYMLRVLDDPAPFEAYEGRSQHFPPNGHASASTDERGTGNAPEEGDGGEWPSGQQPVIPHEHVEVPVILRLNPFLELLGQKLGIRHTQRLLLPRVASFMGRLRNHRLLRALFVSPVWSLLIRLGGTGGFLTHCLPFMLKSLGPETPLEVQQAAYVAVFNLGAPDMLGPGLMARYVIPTLLSGVGAIRQGEGAGVEGAESGTEAASRAASAWDEDLYQARALVNICREIDDDVLVSMVAERLLMEIIPTLAQELVPQPSQAASLALLETISVLTGLLPSLQPSSAIFHYCQQPSVPVQQLLLAIPLPPPPAFPTPSPASSLPGPSFPSTSPRVAPALAPHSPRHHLHVQLGRLVVALSTCVGAVATQDYLLPAINTFLGGFSDMYDQALFFIEEAGGELQEGGTVSAEGAVCAIEETRMAAFDVVEDLWRHLEAMYDEKVLRQLVPNGYKLVAVWFHRLNGPARADREAAGGSRVTVLRNEGARRGRGGGGRAWRREGGDVGERFADMVIEKGLSGLLWIASKSRKGFQRAGGEGHRQAASGMEVPGEAGPEMLKDRIPTAVSKVLREESEEDPRGSPVRRELEEGEEGEEREEGECLQMRRVSTAGKDVLLPISPGSALSSTASPLSLSPVRGQGRASHKLASSDEEEEEEGEEEEGEGHEDDAELGLWGAASSPSLSFHADGSIPHGFPLVANGNRGADARSGRRERSGSVTRSSVGPSLVSGIPFLKKKKDASASLVSTSGSPSQLTGGRSAKREAWSSSVSKDHVWLLGPLIDPPRLEAPEAVADAGSSWPIHLCVQTTLQAYKSGSSVRSLAVDPGETLLLSGSRRGVVKVFSLREHPVALSQMGGGGAESHSESIFSLAFMNGSDQAVSLDGSLLIWDVNTGAVLARKEKYAPEIGGMPLSYMAVDVLPAGGGVGVGDSRSTGTQQQHQLLAATQTTLYHLDLRDRASASSASMVLTQASEWGVSSSCFQDRGIGAALQCVCAHDDAHWICAGSSNGQLCVLDRRTGEIAQAWQAHEGPILRVFPWGRDKVLSVSLDQTAVLWDIRHTIPRDICCLRGLPDSQSGMTLLVHEFRRSSASATAPLISGLGVTGTKRPHVLMSFGGHKGVVARMPRPGMDVAAKARYFLSPNGLKLRAKINVQSAAMLPLRKLLLVGCDDGNIRVCT